MISCSGPGKIITPIKRRSLNICEETLDVVFLFDFLNRGLVWLAASAPIAMDPLQFAPLSPMAVAPALLLG